MNDAPSQVYRPDIDGLRAVAVLSVVFFHIFPKFVAGGFVGVDIFFVISGYLITGLLVKDMDQQAFSFKTFYKRRIKRILPAYLAVSVATIIAASIMLIPNDYIFFTTSLAASWAFASNLFFSMLSGGYFDNRAELFPLLHTWSLSVEEQFYFIFPLLLILLTRLRIRLLLVGLVFVMFAFLAYFLRSHVNQYYLLTTRAHELLAGAFVALLPHREFLRQRPRLSVALAGAGLLLVIYSCFYLNASLPYPGLYSLFPTIGAALLILALDMAPGLAPILANKTMVPIGLVSYSLYLWHWPIIALVKYRGIEIDLAVGLSIMVAASILSYASWRWIELPIRHGGFDFRRSFMYFYLVPAVAIFCFAAVAYKTEGLPGRFSKDVRELILSYSYERDLQRTCSLRDVDFHGLDLKQLETSCGLGNPTTGAPSILLYGDSHANHFKPFLDVIAKDASLSGVYFSMGGCAPVRPAELEREDTCARRNHSVEREFSHFRYVVIAGEWNSKLSTEDFAPLIEEIEKSGAVPVLFKDAPESPKDISRCALNRLRGWLPMDADCSIPIQQVTAHAGNIDQAIDVLKARFPALIVINPKPLLCNESSCVTIIGNTAIYRDTNHLNLQASILLAHRFLDLYGNPLHG